jgi:glucosamine--fructose-6-phosphate aminotransferase (isomerizing)
MISSPSCTMNETTHMFREAGECATVVSRQFADNETVVRELGERLHRSPPHFIMTGARGSSDHAATFAKYVFETRLGIATASSAPSVSSLYGVSQNLAGVLFLVISQSGRSPDLLQQVEAARKAGAMIVALVNDEGSPLAANADYLIPLRAGVERSVAATKSYIASLSAILHLTARWNRDPRLTKALQDLPAVLRTAWALDWSEVVELLVDANNLFVIGRGLGLGIAQEAALKLKETCGLHAEAFSAAEVMHGPMTLVTSGFPVLAFTQGDETRAGLMRLVDEFRARGAPVLVAEPGDARPGHLHVPTIGDPACTPVLAIQTFYRVVNSLALRRGRDPDAPPSLRKVTETV